jgi:D-xylose transport system substrate-binding protein
MGAKRMVLWLAVLAIVVGAAIALTSCGSSGGSSGSASTAAGPKIALLLPESKTARYETQDKPQFEAKVKAICPDCQILYSNANQDATQQQSQAEAALANGAKVLVLDPVDSTSATTIVTKANQAKVPVIAYDRPIPNANLTYFVGFDTRKVGVLQGQALLAKLTSAGDAGKAIVMINGAPTDPNAAQFKAGAHSVLDGKVKIGAEYDTPDWSPDQAQTEMDQAITKLGKNGFVGVYCANDGTAGGAIASMIGAGIDPKTKPTTGQDAELAAIQRILVGQQYMTVYKAIKPEAGDAAMLAVALAKGQSAPASLTLAKIKNGTNQVNALILTPVAVTAANIKSTVVADGFWTAKDICTGAYAAACTSAGIQ